MSRQLKTTIRSHSGGLVERIKMLVFLATVAITDQMSHQSGIESSCWQVWDRKNDTIVDLLTTTVFFCEHWQHLNGVKSERSLVRASFDIKIPFLFFFGFLDRILRAGGLAGVGQEERHDRGPFDHHCLPGHAHLLLLRCHGPSPPIQLIREYQSNQYGNTNTTNTGIPLQPKQEYQNNQYEIPGYNQCRNTRIKPIHEY